MSKYSGVVMALLVVFAATWAGEIKLAYHFPLSDVDLKRADSFDLVSLKGCDIRTSVPGSPSLPGRALQAAIPSTAVLESVIVTLEKPTRIPGTFRVYPAQPPHERANTEAVKFVPPDPATYSSSATYPASCYATVGQATMCGYQLAGAVFYPISYSPGLGQLTLYRDVSVRIRYRDMAFAPHSFSDFQVALWGRIAASSVENPQDVKRFAPPSIHLSFDDEVRFLFITPSDPGIDFSSLRDWYDRKGLLTNEWPVDMIEQNFPGVDIQEKIRNCIRYYVENHGTTYVLLCGRCNAEEGFCAVPRRDVWIADATSQPPDPDRDTIPCDLYYADCIRYPVDYNWDFNGNATYGEMGPRIPPENRSPNRDSVDLVEDVFVGRAPIYTQADVEAFINKDTMYQKAPDPDYVKRVLLCAGSFSTTFPDTFSHNLIGNMVPSGWDSTKLYDGRQNLNHDACVQELDEGYGLVSMSGHGNWSAISRNNSQETYLYRSDLLGLANDRKFGIYFTNSCWTGALDRGGSDGCLAEASVRNPSGGAIAAIMASRSTFQSSELKFERDDELDTMLFHAVLKSGFGGEGIGCCFSYARYRYWAKAMDKWEWRWTWYAYNLTGDPAVPVWLEPPIQLDASFPAQVQTGPQSFSVDVAEQSSKSPVNRALVCLRKPGEVYAYGRTNSAGHVSLSISPSTSGTMNVTVTADTWEKYDPFDGGSTVLGGLPPAPTPTAPPNGGTVGTTTPTLQVQSISGADQYDFRVYQGGNPVAQGAPATNSWTVSPALTNGQTYTWKCRAHNSSGWGPYCAEWSFTVNVSGPPGVPVPVAPPNGGTVTTLRPTLQVQSVPGAIIYRYLVTERGMYVRDGTVGVNSWQLDIDLQNGHIYDWVCRCSTADGRSDWSTSWSFAVDIGGPPPTPEDWPMFHKDLKRAGYSAERISSPYDTAWTADLPTNMRSYTSFAIVDNYVILGTDYIPGNGGYCYCIDTLGDYRWQWNVGSTTGMSTPCIANGKVYYNARSATSTRSTFCNSLTDGSLIWHEPFPPGTYDLGSNAPVAVSGSDVFTHYEYTPSVEPGDSLFCRNANTGARTWAYARSRWQWSWGSAVVDGGYVYILADAADGTNSGLYKLTTSGSYQGFCQMLYPNINCTPALSNGLIYASDASRVVCINPGSMSIVWTQPVSSINGSPAVGSATGYNIVYIGSTDGKLYAFDAAGGSPISGWPKTLSSVAVNSPSIADTVVFCGTGNGHLFAVGGRSGATLFDYNCGAEIKECPAISRGRIYVATASARVFAFRHVAPVAKDVAVLDIQQPSGTVDSGSAVVPVAHVRNYWNQAATFDATFRIGPWSRTRSKTLAAGVTDTVGFPAWTAQPRGTLAVKCTVAFSGDETPGNNYQTGAVDVRVRDVGVVRLVAPSGTIDSGSIVMPACSVYNYGTGTESYNVRMKIGSFYDEIATLSHGASQRLYVTFPNWFVLQRGTQTVKCSTEMAGDVRPGNDKQSGAVTVVIRDAGCTWLGAPCGTVDSGSTVAPACSVHNYGSAAATYTVRMKVGSAYNQVLTVTNQAPNASSYLTFPTWTALQRGTNAVSCSTELSGDIRGYNDRRSTYVLVAVRDVGISHVVAPTGTVDSGTVVTPCAVAQNSGNSYEVFNVVLRIDGGYSQTVSESLSAGVADTVWFPDWTAGPLGMLSVSCSTALSGDRVPGNNRRLDSVRVIPHTSIGGSEAQFRLPTYFALRDVRPNPVADFARISYDLPVSCYNQIAVFDIHGREVARLVSALESPGRYDLAWSRVGLHGGRLPSGVYFCRMHADSFCAVRKFLLLQ